MMAEKPAAVKLGLKPGERLVVLRPVAGLADILGALPAGAVMADSGEVVLMFSHDRAELLAGLAAAKAAGGRLWLAYLKAVPGRKPDLNRDSLRELVAGHGLETVSQVALNADWSALRVKVVA
ncbi:MAG: hypothetical protein ABI832_07495 [bacterium]